MRPLRLVLIAAVAGAGGEACGPPRAELGLPRPVSDSPVARAGGLRAGFGRVDITPPPGVGLNGNGFEGQQARGYRHRLYARALVLESDAGERVALVVADLGQVSVVLHRLTADRVSRAGTGIGADRLILSATHSHSAPGNFFETDQYNAQAGTFPGYDPAMVEFLVSRFDSAVRAAVGELGPARAAWGAAAVLGVTRNRSLDALLRDPEATVILGPGASAPGAANDSALMRRAVNDTLLMLRVDRCGPRWTECRPRGAFTIFAVHGTVYPPVNDLLDADIQGFGARALERYIDSMAPPGSGTPAVHLVANGTEGDVSPEWPAGSRCDDALEFRAGRRAAGPRTPQPPEEWRPPEGRLRACLDQARHAAQTLGSRLGSAATQLYKTLEAGLSPQFPVARAFETVDLTHLDTPHRVCDQPLTGTAAYAGAEDGRTRLYGWKFLWLIPSGMEDGGHAVKASRRGCHGAKQIGLGGLQKLLVGRHGLPHIAQLAVVRLGSTLLAAVPAEVTTVAGMRLKQALRDSGPPGMRQVGILGLANGYMQYIPTAEEYDAQDYEGGSAIYGPNSAAALTEALSSLAATLAHGTPRVQVDTVIATPGPSHSYFPRPGTGPDPVRVTRRFVVVACSAATLEAQWIDVYPGTLVPADGPVLQIQRAVDSGPVWRTVAGDDGLEVRAKRPLGGAGYRWGVSASALEPGRYRVMLEARPGLPAVASDLVACPGASPVH